jgi:Leucine-rich repeat (LRR) protein
LLETIYSHSYFSERRFDLIEEFSFIHRINTINAFTVQRERDVLLLRGLTFIPFIIGDLTKLQTLKLTGGSISELPVEMGNLELLKTLSLDSNHLTSLEGLGNLKQLEDLSAHSNRIKEIPLSICGLTNLKKLGLYGNQIEQVPEEITALKKLHSIDLKDNKIVSLRPITINFLMHRGFSLP